MRIVLQKKLRFSARRAFQGTVAFSAFGALIVAAATPASADTVLYGHGAAHIAMDAFSLQAENPTAQGEEDSVSDSYQGAPRNHLTVDADLSTTVDADGVHSTVVINSARAEITQEDLNDILEELPDEYVDIEGSAEDVEELAAKAEAGTDDN